MSVTLGAAGQPNQLITNLDAVFSTSLANYNRTLVDNITKTNAFFYELKKGGMWDGINGGSDMRETLMYGLATPQAYTGYDVLSTDPTNGITQAIYQWAQAAVPCSISGLEEIQNRQRISNLVMDKIMQSEMGIKEWFVKAFLQGSFLSGGSSFITPYVEPTNSAQFINPLFLLVNYDQTPVGGYSDAAVTVGGITNNSTNSWWRNPCIASVATTYLQLLLEFDTMYDFCARGPGGPPNIIWTDELTKRLLNAAYYAKYQTQMATDANYPFEHVQFRKAKIVCDEFMVDPHTGATNCDTKGTAVFLNTKFMKIKYDNATNFKAGNFKSPVNQDASVKHILWAGQSTINNRRKCGVIGNIARTLT